MKRDFRAPKNKGTFEANFAKKKYPQNRKQKNQARQGVLKPKSKRNCVRESSLHNAIPTIRRGGQ